MYFCAFNLPSLPSLAVEVNLETTNHKEVRAALSHKSNVLSTLILHGVGSITVPSAGKPSPLHSDCCHFSDVTGNEKVGSSKADSYVNAAGFILDKAVVPSKPESKSTIDIKDWHNPTNQQQRKTTLTMTTLLNYMTQNSSLLKPDTWIASSGKLLNLKCTHTTSTQKMA